MSKKILFALLFGYFFRAFQKSFIWWAIKDATKKSLIKEMTKMKKTDGTETAEQLKDVDDKDGSMRKGPYPWGSATASTKYGN